MTPPRTPTVGGQSARIIADIIRTFLVHVDPCGCRFLTAKPQGQSKVIFEKAYAMVELEVMSDPPRCQCADVNHPPTADEIEWLIVSEMMAQARHALGEEGTPDAFHRLYPR
jgi:hypothetical protein